MVPESRAASWSGADLLGVAGSKVGFGGSPDRNRYGTARIIGFDGKGGTYVQGTSGTLDRTSALFRFAADGHPDRTFNQRLKPRFGRDSSAAVVGNRILVADGRRLTAFTPQGRVDTSFGQDGELVTKRFLQQVVAYGKTRFYLVSSIRRFDVGQVRLERYTATGRRVAGSLVEGGQWFGIKDVSAGGDVAFVAGWDPGDYGSEEVLSVIDSALDSKPVSIASIQYTGFGDVHFLAGGKLLVSDGGETTALDEKGKPVTAFGEEGVLRCLPAAEPDYDGGSPALTTVDPAGRIVGVASFGNGNCGVQRFTGDGTPDPGFDHVSASAGLAGQVKWPSDVAVSGERIMVSWWDAEHGGPGLLAIEDGGEVDTAFGSGGKAHAVLLTPDRSSPTDSVVDTRGRILVAGLNRSADGHSKRLALARFRRDGSPDRSFGQKGRVRLDLGEKVVLAAMTRLKSGEIMVSGTLENEEKETSGFLLRLTAAGRVDRRFGENGLRRVDVPGYASTSFLGSRAFGPGLLLAGSVCCSEKGQDALVASFDRRGKLVGSFGDGGLVIRDLFDLPADRGAAGDSDRAVALDLDRAGRPVILAETTPRGAYPKPVSFGLTIEGKPSRLFRGRVVRVPAFRLAKDGTGKYWRWAMNLDASGVEVLPSGRILYAMGREGRQFIRYSTTANTIGHMTVLNRKGNLDRSFGTRGQVSSRSLSFQDVALDSCGRILVGGSSQKKSIFSFGLARYRPDGRFDGASRPGGYRLGGPNSLERGTTLAVAGDRAFVAGPLAPEYRSTSFGLVGFRAGGKCG
ncbi:MAG: hypothetical protein BGO23_06760 [Solirubrobacterales bacterium 67-14]|nr:MAG: hypothetical protein BGO23_06760 [Solirubrobacterales bacterium 67-14]